MYSILVGTKKGLLLSAASIMLSEVNVSQLLLFPLPSTMRVSQHITFSGASSSFFEYVRAFFLSRAFILYQDDDIDGTTA